MRIDANGLQLELCSQSTFDIHGDARISIAFSLPDVTGAYESWIRRTALDTFISQLQQMAATLVEGSSATLATWEADYVIQLTLRGLGHIDGQYELAPGVANDSQVAVTGNFRLDQSYLPALIDELQRFERDLGGPSL